MEEKRKKLTKNQSLLALKRLIPYFGPYKKSLVFDLFCAALTTVCELVLPMIVRRITNAATGESAEVLTPGLILSIGCIYIFLRFVDALASYYMNSYGHIMGTRIETDLRRDLFSHLQKLSFSYYNNAKIGVLMSRITNDLFDITEFAHHCPEEFFIAGVKIVGSFAILCTVNIPLTLIIFAMLPGMVRSVRPVQPAKAPLPKAVTPSAMRSSVRPVQPLNAYSPMPVTLPGITTEVIFFHL